MSEDTSGFLVFLFFTIIITSAICFSIIQYKNKRRRNEQLLFFAATNNYEYSYYDPFNISGRYYYYELLSKGDTCETFNVISGSRQGKSFKIFDHKYTETSGSGSDRHESTHEFSALIVDIPGIFKDLFIRPENFGDKIAGAVGFDDIDFESEEFSRTFYVKSSDKKFAYDIIHPKAMEYLIQHPGWIMEMKSSSIMIRKNESMFDPLEMESHLNFIYGFIDLIPEYVWQANS